MGSLGAGLTIAPHPPPRPPQVRHFLCALRPPAADPPPERTTTRPFGPQHRPNQEETIQNRLNRQRLEVLLRARRQELLRNRLRVPQRVAEDRSQQLPQVSPQALRQASP